MKVTRITDTTFREIMSQWIVRRRGDVVGQYVLCLIIGFFVGMAACWR